MVASVVVQSVTNQEISRFWKQRHMLEEDHLYAAIKAAARLRARNLSDDDYLQFEDSLKEDDKSKEKFGEKYEHKDSRVGIKDWWTKSKYAYLNQPAMKLVDDATIISLDSSVTNTLLISTASYGCCTNKLSYVC